MVSEKDKYKEPDFGAIPKSSYKFTSRQGFEGVMNAAFGEVIDETCKDYGLCEKMHKRICDRATINEPKVAFDTLKNGKACHRILRAEDGEHVMNVIMFHANGQAAMVGTSDEYSKLHLEALKRMQDKEKEIDESKIYAIEGIVKRKLLLGIRGSFYTAVVMDIGGDTHFAVLDLDSAVEIDTVKLPSHGIISKDMKRAIEKTKHKSIFDGADVGSKLDVSGYETGSEIDVEYIDGGTKRCPMFVGVIVKKL